MADEKKPRQEFSIKNLEGGIINFGEMTFKDRVELTQYINSLPHGDPAEKAELQALVEQLSAELEQLSAEHKREAEIVGKRLKALLSELEAEEPDEEEVLDSGERLKKAAQNIATVMPAVLHIATQIVQHAQEMIK